MGPCSVGSDAERERLLEMVGLISKVGENAAQRRQRVLEAEKSHESLWKRVSQMTGSRVQWQAGY